MILEAQARINASGNLSLGQSGSDDAAGDTTQGYAKADCRVILQHTTFQTALPATNLTETVTRTSAGIWSRVYTAGGAVDAFVLIQPAQLIARLCSAALNPPYATNQPHGFKITSFDLNYIIATAGATSVTVRAQTETYQTNNTARANLSTTPLGTTTVQNPIGTVVASLPVATQAAPYQTRTVFGTPVFVTAQTDPAGLPGLNLEVELVLPNTCVLTVTYAAVNFSWAMY